MTDLDVTVSNDMAHLSFRPGNQPVSGQLLEFVMSKFGKHWGRYWATKNGVTFPIYRRHKDAPSTDEGEAILGGQRYRIHATIHLDEPHDGEAMTARRG